MIIGERVRLRGMEKSDLPAFMRWPNDPDVRRNPDIFIPLSMGHEEKWYADVQNRLIEEHPRCIEARKDENWMFVGNLSFMQIGQINRCADIGILIGEKKLR